MLGSTGRRVSLVGLGALEVGRAWGYGEATFRAPPTDSEAALFLNGALDLGVTLIDTARAYLLSEERIGVALADRRSEYFLATKCGEHSRGDDTYYDFSYDAVHASIRQSLETLATSRIDLMQIHFGPEPWQVTVKGDTLRAVLAAQERGEVQFLGASVYTDMIMPFVRSKMFQVLQVELSLLNRQAEEAVAAAADAGVGILVRLPFRMGALTPRGRALYATDEMWQKRLDPLLEVVGGDWSALPGLALDYLRTVPGVSSILVGTKNLDHLREATARMSEPLSDKMARRVQEASEALAAL